MTATITERFSPAVEELKEMLSSIELSVLTNYTLADAIREGCGVTDKVQNYGSGRQACALSAAAVSAAARGYIV